MKIGLIGDSLTEGRPGVSFFKILQEQFVADKFVNLGKPGESIKSLHSRLTKSKLETDYELTFLWIGVNDVYAKLLSVQAQPIAKDHEEFKDYYQKVLEIVLASSKQVVTVSPALVGENTTSVSNKEIKHLSTIIQSISSQYPNVRFLNMQSVFEEHLAKVKSSDYISTKVMRVMLDVLFYKNPNRINQLSQKRGLHFTMDGVHFNSTGARIVAAEYASTIDRLLYNRH
ncbi:SGNH/GDSL hydrolase family protein [Bacillus sp. CGMCC 1.60114]|uniref:SGNH/GDSL hydrolase family protein n=1 Tax=unclassified Bacillus (in: firmicutes) TaxID=185979 RepID=UPI003626556E